MVLKCKQAMLLKNKCITGFNIHSVSPCTFWSLEVHILWIKDKILTPQPVKHGTANTEVRELETGCTGNQVQQQLLANSFHVDKIVITYCITNH